jgi:hypothetical protein
MPLIWQNLAYSGIFRRIDFVDSGTVKLDQKAKKNSEKKWLILKFKRQITMPHGGFAAAHKYLDDFSMRRTPASMIAIVLAEESTSDHPAARWRNWELAVIYCQQHR